MSYHIRFIISLLACLLAFSSVIAWTFSPSDDDEDKIAYDPSPIKSASPEKLPYSDLNGVHPGQLLYAPGSSPFLMTSYKQNNNDMKDNVIVMNLLTGKQVGILRNLAMPNNPTFMTDRLALSADGQLIAQYHLESRGIRIIQVKAARVQRVLPYQATNVILLFTQPDQLLAIRTDSGNEQAILWQVSTGKELRQTKLPGNLETNAGQASVSPGGKLLAVPESDNHAIGGPNHLGLYDITTGKKLRDFWASNRPTPPGVIFKAVSFSPDGKELAAIVQLPDRVNAGATNAHIVVWDFTTGTRKTNVQIERGNRGGLILAAVDPLQWFPDQQAFFVNQQMVINRADGKLLEYLKADGHIHAHYAARVLDDNRIFWYVPHNKLTIRTIKR